jgi:2-dehydropantoate 2-reductase
MRIAVFLVRLSGTTGLARSAVGPIRSHPPARAFLHDVMAEVVQAARAQGVPLPADYSAGQGAGAAAGSKAAENR